MPENLIFSEAEWAALPAHLSDPFFQRVHENNERAVALMLEQGRDDIWRLGGDLRDPSCHRANPLFWRIPKHRLLRFSVSWRLTGRPDTLREALRTVDVLLDPSLWILEPSYGLTHADLRTADWWTSAAFALEALAPALSPSQKTGLVRLLADWALPAYLRGIEAGEWWRDCDFNWGAAVHGAAGIAALAVRREAPEVSARTLAAAKHGLTFVLQNFPPGGGWTEGLMYQTTTLSHLTDFVAALHRLTGDDLGLLADPRLHAFIDSRPWLLGGDHFPLNFSNINEHSQEWRCPAAYWWARHCNRPDWAGFEDAYPRLWHDTLGICQEVETFWHRAPHQPAVPHTAPSGLWHGQSLDWLSWKRGQTWLAFRAGFNGGNHNNLDLGQLIFGFGDQRLLGDPGYGVSATARHSCVTLRGRDQTMDATARILHAAEFPFADSWALHLCCDLQACYPHTLARHHRHVLATSDGALLLIDDLLGLSGRRIGAKGHLQFKLPPAPDPAGWRIPAPAGDVLLRTHLPLAWQAGQPVENQGASLTPLTYTPAYDRTDVRFALSLSPASAPAPALTPDGPDRLLVRLPLLHATLDLSNGRLSLSST